MTGFFWDTKILRRIAVSKGKKLTFYFRKSEKIAHMKFVKQIIISALRKNIRAGSRARIFQDMQIIFGFPGKRDRNNHLTIVKEGNDFLSGLMMHIRLANDVSSSAQRKSPKG
jgi:hypothetical protein